MEEQNKSFPVAESSIKNLGNKIVSISKATGHYVLAQSQTLSEHYAIHKDRLKKVDSYNEIFVHEQKILIDLRAKLWERYCLAGPEECIEIQSKLETIDQSINKARIGQKAIKYVDLESQDEASEENTVSDSWISRFNELAKLNNEDWRQDLLARALAKEANEPNSISLRLLWTIGTLDKASFDDFSSLLDIASTINGEEIILYTDEYRNLGDIVIEGNPHSNNKVGNIVYRLHDSGLLADSDVRHQVDSGEIIRIGYGQKFYNVKCKTNLNIQGIILTELGFLLASLHNSTTNRLGVNIFECWVKENKNSKFDILDETDD